MLTACWPGPAIASAGQVTDAHRWLATAGASVHTSLVRPCSRCCKSSCCCSHAAYTLLARARFGQAADAYTFLAPALVAAARTLLPGPLSLLQVKLLLLRRYWSGLALDAASHADLTFTLQFFLAALSLLSRCTCAFFSLHFEHAAALLRLLLLP